MDMAQENLRLSALKRAEANANAGQDVWKTGPGDMAITHAAGTKSGVPLEQRPLSSTGRRSVPEKIELMGDQGPIEGLNPDAGLDEVGQVYYLWQKLKEAAGPTKRWKKDVGGYWNTKRSYGRKK